MTNFDEDSSYYRAIFDLGPELSDELLPALRDVVADAALYSRALDEDVMGISLLRSVTARSIEGQFRRILAGGTVLTEYSFRYEAPIPQNERVERLTLEFEVTPDSTPPTNIHVLIGRNGVGKTYLLNGMTKALVRPDKSPDDSGVFRTGENVFGQSSENPFANILSITFSAFDDFELVPERKNVSRGVRYSNVGLRKRVKNRSDDWVTITRDPAELAEEFSLSAKLCAKGEKATRWQAALTTLQADPIFADAEVARLVAGQVPCHPMAADLLGQKECASEIALYVAVCQETTREIRDGVCSPTLPEACRGRRLFAGNLGQVLGRRLSDASGARRRRLSACRLYRHHNPTDLGLAVGQTRPAVRRREPSRRQQQYRHRVRRTLRSGRLHVAADRRRQWLQRDAATISISISSAISPLWRAW